MEAAAAKASPRKDLTEKQPAVAVQRDAVVLKNFDRLLKKFEAEKLSSFLGLRSIRLPFSPPKAAATGHNTVRFRSAEKFNALPLTFSSKGPIIPIEKNQKSKPYPLALDGGRAVFFNPEALDGGGAVLVNMHEVLDGARDALAAVARVVATSYGVPDGGHVDFTANALAANPLDGSLISSTSFDQMVGYPLDLDGGGAVLVNPHEVLDGGRVVLANPDGALDGGGAVLVNPHEVLDGGRVVLANLHGAAVARVVAISYGGANGVGDVLANLYGAGAFRVVLANSYGAVDRGRVVADPDGEADRVHGRAVNRGHARAPRYLFALAHPDGALDGGRAVFADLYGAADRVHDVAVHMGHTHALADEANDARTSADEANDV